MSYFSRYYKRNEGDELVWFTHKQLIEKQKKILSYLIKTIGLNLLSGKSVMSISLPINIFDTRTILETFAFQNLYSPYYFSLAAEEPNPVSKIKIVISSILFSIELAMNQLKPFNPILGETFQCMLGETELYVEQTSHHPPIFNYQVLSLIR